MNYNRTQLAGHVARDPELKYTDKGTAITRLDMGINHEWRDKDGNQQSEVTWVTLDAFGKTAESLAKHARKGSNLFIEGRLRLNEWQDKQTQEKRNRLTVVCERWMFAGGRQEKAEARAEPERKIHEEDVPVEKSASNEDDVPF